jgi:hypothetical protein
MYACVPAGIEIRVHTYLENLQLFVALDKRMQNANFHMISQKQALRLLLPGLIHCFRSIATLATKLLL